MAYRSHKKREEGTDAAQVGNRRWWTEHPMTYDWRGTISTSRLEPEWFDEMDRRFIQASFPYQSEQQPFDLTMPPDLSGRAVLEIGCGMGLHSEHLARRGAEVTAIDLTPGAVDATARRAQLKGLAIQAVQGDAEDLQFEDHSFDFVWSWGVIHHTARTGRAVREIARVLRPDGQARLMVYNREALLVRINLLRYYVLGCGFWHNTPDEVLWEHSDGYIARHYHQEQFEDLLRTFFREVSSRVLGQDADVVPLPHQLRGSVMRILTNERRRQIASTTGWFLFATASNPD